MDKRGKIVVLIIVVTAIIGLSSYTYVAAETQPLSINTVSWNVAENHIVSIMPVKYVNLNIDGQNVTMVVQLLTPDHTEYANLVFGENILLMFVSNASSIVLHARATLNSVTINGSNLLLSGNSIIQQENVFNNIVYEHGYNGFSYWNNATLPNEETANVTVNISSTFGPYWNVVKTVSLTL